MHTTTFRLFCQPNYDQLSVRVLCPGFSSTFLRSAFCSRSHCHFSSFLRHVSNRFAISNTFSNCHRSLPEGVLWLQYSQKSRSNEGAYRPRNGFICSSKLLVSTILVCRGLFLGWRFVKSNSTLSNRFSISVNWWSFIFFFFRPDPPAGGLDEGSFFDAVSSA